MNEYASHLNPLWRERADFIIQARIDGDETKKWEQLWCRQLSSNRFELCCIPAFVYDLALGDEVETVPSYGKQYVVHQVVRPSGHFTFRIWFGESRATPPMRQDMIETLIRLGALLEWYSNNLLMVDTTAALAQNVADYLHAAQESGLLVYETGRTRRARCDPSDS